MPLHTLYQHDTTIELVVKQETFFSFSSQLPKATWKFFPSSQFRLATNFISFLLISCLDYSNNILTSNYHSKCISNDLSKTVAVSMIYKMKSIPNHALKNPLPLLPYFSALFSILLILPYETSECICHGFYWAHTFFFLECPSFYPKFLNNIQDTAESSLWHRLLSLSGGLKSCLLKDGLLVLFQHKIISFFD